MVPATAYQCNTATRGFRVRVRVLCVLFWLVLVLVLVLVLLWLVLVLLSVCGGVYSGIVALPLVGPNHWGSSAARGASWLAETALA
jgi:hypothetical protein